MITNKTMNRERRGFTLTEAAIVLGIVGLILGAIWVAAAAVYNNMRTNTAQRQLLTIVQNIRSVHATQPTFATMTCQQASVAGIYPSDMVTNPGVAGATCQNVWRGAVVLTAVNAGAAFQIDMVNVPNTSCVSLLTNTTGTSRDTGILFAGTAAPGNNPTLTSYTAATAAAQCTSTTNNHMFFVFSLKS